MRDFPDFAVTEFICNIKISLWSTTQPVKTVVKMSAGLSQFLNLMCFIRESNLGLVEVNC